VVDLVKLRTEVAWFCHTSAVYWSTSWLCNWVTINLRHFIY